MSDDFPGDSLRLSLIAHCTCVSRLLSTVCVLGTAGFNYDYRDAQHALMVTLTLPLRLDVIAHSYDATGSRYKLFSIAHWIKHLFRCSLR